MYIIKPVQLNRSKRKDCNRKMQKTNFLNKYFAKLYNPPEASKDFTPPALGIRRFFYLLRTQLGKLVFLNLLFILFCIPIVTIPASIAALNHVILLLVRNGECSIWKDFKDEFKTSFLKGIVIGGVGLAIFALLGYTIWLYNSLNFDLSIFAVTVLIALIIFLLIYLDYLFVLLGFFDMPLKALFKNAALLAIAEPLCTLKLLIPRMLFGLTLFYFMYTFPIYLILLFSIMQLAKCNIINRVLDSHITTSKTV